MSTPPQPFLDVRMKGFGKRVAVATVLAALKARTTPLPANEVPLSAAAGGVLAEAVVSAVNVPAFARSAMDGYAVRAADTNPPVPPVPLAVVGAAFPARPFAGTVETRQAVLITTGAPIPSGADAVLRAEAAQLGEDASVLPGVALTPGRHVVPVGEDVAKGQSVLPAGRQLRPQDVGLLASIGVGVVRVHRRPRVAILVTGNELVPPGSIPEGFRIVDSNSPMLAALVARDGGECLPTKYVPDDYAAVRDSIRDTDADVILVTGGTSVGTEDHAPRAVAELGELAFHGVALRPGGPFGVGFLRGQGVGSGQGDKETRRQGEKANMVSVGPLVPVSPCPLVLSVPVSPCPLVLLLPGNPLSCLCTYDLFAGRLVRRLGGRSWELPYRTLNVPLDENIASTAGRVDYVRVKIEKGKALPVAGGASNLSGAVVADGFVLVEEDRAELAQGESVQVWLYEG